jgi:uncharacterized HAD superfamily protein|tara:strand:+ start:331 stop:639 length:309 start_codon:yes stop_codon:yes gene_type:complete
MIIYIDIDETICHHPYETDEHPRDYTKAEPISKNIKKANSLYEDGHTIIYWTARGTTTGLDWSDLTRKQFLEWGIKFHDIKFGKPYYDLFIDDKNMNVTDWV